MDIKMRQDLFQLSRRDLFQTLFAGSMAGVVRESETRTTTEEPAGMARCTALKVETRYGAFQVGDLALDLRDFTLTGSATNHTDRSWRWVTFLLTLRDRDGQAIRHDDRFDGFLYLKNVRQGDSRPLLAADGQPPRLLLRPSQSPAAIDIRFVPELSYFDSRYTFSLVHPAPSSELTYQDDALGIAFTVTTTELQFKLTNHLSDPMALDWEKAAYVDLYGTRHRVIHRGVPLGEKDNKQTATRLEAGITIDEMVYPADLVAGSRVFQDWRLNPLLPVSQYAVGYRWHTFGLILPVTILDRTRPYLFTLGIENVLSV